MRDPLTTRRLLAKIDRDADLFVIADRMRQAIYDIDDYTGRLDARINALEQEKVKFVTETGVNKVLENRANRETARLSKKAFWWLISVGGSAIAMSVAWLSRHVEWK